MGSLSKCRRGRELGRLSGAPPRLHDGATAANVSADPSYIPAGASDHPLGGMGFTNLVLELAEQEKTLGVFFDTLVVCSVTGSSHAGLIVGAVAEGKGRKVIGIDASGKPAQTKAQVARIARDTAKRLDPALEIPDEAIVLDERFHAGIYGVPDEQTLEAIKCEWAWARGDGGLGAGREWGRWEVGG